MLYTPTIIGSPTFTGNKFNSNGNTGLSYPVMLFGSNAWSIQGKFKSTNTSTIQTFYGNSGVFDFVLQKTTANKLAIYLSSNLSSWNIANGTLGTKSDWSISTEYYIRTRFTGTQYLVDWSTDYNPSTQAGTWTNDITISSSTAIYGLSTYTSFGIFSNTNISPLIGTMGDLQVTIGSDTIQSRTMQVPNIVETDVLGRTHTITADETITGMTNNGTYEMLKSMTWQLVLL